MGVVHAVLAACFGALLAPFERLGLAGGLCAVSALGGIVLLAAFRWTSNPAAIRSARRQVEAHLLAVRLYRDDVSVVMRAQAGMLRGLGLYLAQMLVPFAAAAVPFALLFAHLDARYGSRALHPGERAVVKVTAAPSVVDAPVLESSAGVVVESGPVRIPARSEIAWRIRADLPGRHRVTVVSGGHRIDKEVRISESAAGADPRRAAATIASLFRAPTEPVIEPGTDVEAIEIGYPALDLRIFGWRTSWIAVFLAVSALVALVLRRRAGVEW